VILGRPTNLWNGLVVAAVSLVSIVVMQLLPDVDSEVVATIGAAITLFFGAAISLLANQPPTVTAGSTVNVVTPKGQQNYEVEV
jgi:protein-S-isoprenylcysteine O-methyltransferase Ste14